MSIIPPELFEERVRPNTPKTNDAEQDTAVSPFNKLLFIIKDKEDYGEHSGHFQSETLPIMQTMSIDELLQNNGNLLTMASKKALPHTVEYLMQATNDWSKETVQSCMIFASKNGYDMTIGSLIKNTKHLDAVLFKTIYDCAKDSDMRSTLNKFKNKQIGKNWKITEDYEIERKNNDIKQIFNFAACHVTTIVDKRITQRNFSDFQSDGEITIAYNKLQRFIVNPPAYNGKCTTSHRRVNRTNKL